MTDQKPVPHSSVNDVYNTPTKTTNTPPILRKCAPFAVGSLRVEVSDIVPDSPDIQPNRTPPSEKNLPISLPVTISPGTALCPKKREKVLQQLLESPVPVPRGNTPLPESSGPLQAKPRVSEVESRKSSPQVNSLVKSQVKIPECQEIS